MNSVSLLIIMVHISELAWDGFMSQLCLVIIVQKIYYNFSPFNMFNYHGN